MDLDEILFGGEDDILSTSKEKEFFANLSLNSPLVSRNLMKAVTNGKLRPQEELDVLGLEESSGTKRTSWDICVQNHIRGIFNLFEECDPTNPVVMKLSVQSALKMIKSGPGSNMNLTDKTFIPSMVLSQLTCYSDWFDYVMVKKVNNTFDVSSQNKQSRIELMNLKGYTIVLRMGENMSLLEYKNGRLLLSHETLSMIADVVRSRRNALLYTEIRNHFKFEVQIPVYKLMTMWDLGDKITEKAGNDGISLLKMWEPLINGKAHVMTCDPLIDTPAFYEKMKADFLDNADELDIKKEALALIKFIDDVENIDELIEYHGLAKTFGHPYVFVEKAIEKNKSMSMPHKKIDQETLIGVEAELIRGICQGHFDKHGCWPKSDTTGLKNPPLYLKNVPSYREGFQSEYHRLVCSPIRKAFMNREPVDVLLPAYHRSDWHRIRLLKNTDDWKTINPLTLLKDKSCSPTLTQLKESIRTKVPVEWTEKRVLSNFLSHNYPKTEEFVLRVDMYGLTTDSLLIDLSPKEREMNSTPRLFSIMPMELKQYFGTGEEIIAQIFLPFFSECTMKDDLMKLNTKFVKNVVITQDNAGIINCYISIDFQKWNLTFRRSNTETFFGILDNYCGLTNFLRRTHQIFEDIRFYFNDYDDPLKLDENGNIKDSYYTWTGQGGGCEGLRQKGWTLITICALRYALSQFDEELSFDILGQGDNQVICLRIPTPQSKNIKNLDENDKQYIRDKIDKVLEKVFEVSGKLGLPIKTEETWASTSFFNYGKNIFVNGKPKGTAMKRILRVFPYSNEEYPTLSAALTAMSASCMSAVAQSITPIIPFVFQAIRCYEIIDHHIGCGVLSRRGIMEHVRTSNPDHRRFTTNMNIFLTSFVPQRAKRSTLLHFAILLGCNILGGSTVSSLWEFYLRGSSDPLSLQTSMLMSFLENDSFDPIERKVIENLLDPIFDINGNMSNLIEDPLSINIVQGISTVGTMKRRARQVLSDPMIENKDMKAALQIGFDNEELVNDYLLSIRPYYSTVITDLKKATLPGLVRSWEGRFDNTRTISKFTRQKGVSLHQEIRKADISTTLGWIYQLSNRGQNEIPKCPTLYAQKLRDDSWTLISPTTMTIKGVTCPHPFHLFKISNFRAICGDCVKDPTRIELYFSKESSNRPSLLQDKLGKNHPYLGSGTKEKLATKAWETKRIPQQVMTAAKNLRLDGWSIKKGSNLCQFLRDTFNCYTDSDPTLYETKEGYATGGMDHRLSSSTVQKQGILPTMLTPATHVSINTNNMGIYARGAGNYPIHFQGINVSNMLAEVTTRLINDLPGSQNTHLHINCKECLVPLDEDYLDTKNKPPNIPRLPENSPFYIKKEYVMRTAISKVVLDTEDTGVNFEDISGKIILRTNLVARRCARDIMADKSKDGHIPASWFFDMDMRALFSTIRYYCCLIHLAKQLGSDRVLAIKRSKKLDKTELYREVAQIIYSKELEFFRTLTTVFQDERNLILVAKDPDMSTYYPPGFPPKHRQILQMIKNVIMIDWEIPRISHTYLTEELRHANAARTIIGASIMDKLSLENTIAPNTGGYTYMQKCNSIFKDMLNEDRVVGINDLIGCFSETNVFNTKDPNLLGLYIGSAVVMQEMILSYVKRKLRIFDVGDDYIIKKLRSGFDHDIDPRKQVKSLHLSNGAEIKVDIENRCTPIILEDCEKVHYRCADVSRVLSTTKGPILASFLDRVKLDGKTVYMIADGSGGTSLALSLYFPTLEIVVLPYIPEGDIFNQSLSTKPPEVARFNPGARVRVEANSLDITSSDSVERLQSIGDEHSIFFMDLDSIKENIPIWIENFVNGAIGRQCMILMSGYTERTCKILVGWIHNNSETKVLLSGINESLAYLVSFESRGINRSSVAMANFVGSSWSNTIISDFEKVLVPNREDMLTRSRSYLSFFKSSDDQYEILKKLMTKLDDFIRNPLYETKTRSHSRTQMNGIMADILARLLIYLSQCGGGRSINVKGKCLIICKTFETGESEKNTRDLNEVGCFLTNGQPNNPEGHSYRIMHLYEGKRAKDNNTHVMAFCDSLKMNHKGCDGSCDKRKFLKKMSNNAYHILNIKNFYNPAYKRSAN